MPARSNSFQRLFYSLYRQLSPTDFTVKESALLRSWNGAQREIDILIEGVVSGVPLRIAIECRDHRRKQTLQWIDDLVGKYSDLDVDKVIAISRSGFSSTVAEKARRNRIELRTLQSATRNNWPAEFQTLAMSWLTCEYQFSKITLQCDPPLISEVQPSDCLLDHSRLCIGTFENWMQANWPAVLESVQRYVSSNFGSIFRTIADLRKVLCIEKTLVPEGAVIIVQEQEHRILTVIWALTLTNRVALPKIDRFTFDRFGIVSGRVELGPQSFRFETLQERGSSSVRIALDPELPGIPRFVEPAE